jgi:hypothetical protein
MTVLIKTWFLEFLLTHHESSGPPIKITQHSQCSCFTRLALSSLKDKSCAYIYVLSVRLQKITIPPYVICRLLFYPEKEVQGIDLYDQYRSSSITTSSRITKKLKVTLDVLCAVQNYIKAERCGPLERSTKIEKNRNDVWHHAIGAAVSRLPNIYMRNLRVVFRVDASTR